MQAIALRAIHIHTHDTSLARVGGDPAHQVVQLAAVLMINSENEVPIEGRSDTAALAHSLNRYEDSFAPRYLQYHVCVICVMCVARLRSS